VAKLTKLTLGGGVGAGRQAAIRLLQFIPRPFSSIPQHGKVPYLLQFIFLHLLLSFLHSRERERRPYLLPFKRGPSLGPVLPCLSPPYFSSKTHPDHFPTDHVPALHHVPKSLTIPTARATCDCACNPTHQLSPGHPGEAGMCFNHCMPIPGLCSA
jgi:hypothetical protein